MSSTCTVNLLPECCHDARRRAVRRSAWTVVVLCATLFVAGTWVAVGTTNRGLQRLDRQLAGEQTKQSELDRQLVLATLRRNDLIERARALAALRRQHPEHASLPEQLLTLTRLAPEGVVFTEIRSQPAGGARTNRGRSPVRSPAQASAPRPAVGAAARPPAEKPPRPDRPPPPPVQMSGYAVDHDQLARLIEAVQRVPQWEQVELLRAARQPYHTGVALAFQLACRPEEVPR